LSRAGHFSAVDRSALMMDPSPPARTSEDLGDALAFAVRSSGYRFSLSCVGWAARIFGRAPVSGPLRIPPSSAFPWQKVCRALVARI